MTAVKLHFFFLLRLILRNLVHIGNDNAVYANVKIQTAKSMLSTKIVNTLVYITWRVEFFFFSFSYPYFLFLFNFLLLFFFFFLLSFFLFYAVEYCWAWSTYIPNSRRRRLKNLQPSHIFLRHLILVNYRSN